MNRLTALLVLGLATCVAAKPPPGTSSLKPAFPETKIGNQIWMASNLDVDVFANGDKIPQAASQAEWDLAGKDAKPAWAWRGFKAGNGAAPGRVYNWYAVVDGRSLAPLGWHVPTREEIGKSLRVTERPGWDAPGGWWSATPKDAKEAYALKADSTGKAALRWAGRADGMSVRCIKQAEP